MLLNTTPDGAIRGHIYKITAPGFAKVYVGSTRLTLRQRMGQHRLNLRKWQRSRYHFVSVFDVLDHLGAEIHLLEEGPFKDKQHMREREAHYIQSLPSVNKCMPGRSQVESCRICHARMVMCPTCGKRVSSGNRLRHNRSRKCLLANAAPQLVEALASVGTV